MDELEFCIKSMSYPLGMCVENLLREEGGTLTISGNALLLPKIPFAAKCYLTGLLLFASLDVVDRKRLSDDYQKLEEFKQKILNSELGKTVGDYLREPWEYIRVGTSTTIDWLEFERREEEVKPYLRRIVELREQTSDRSEFLAKADFLSELSVDAALLLSYLSEEAGLKELVNAALGKHNREFREMVVRYFKALRG
ncbi:hypothetical protein [Thermococcus barossii]|uniref:Uncharacterized protein n=1 Tax=Thermococcus barossii TaxID=54077 RepID=A0A2Z2MNM3_9EURY|nr:hypothetical protein [Thermococcus barossii]ASJ03991.1 hypothetical protein A3L01_00890 [Thermococcus barossii]